MPKTEAETHFDLFVIGAGSGGVRAARKASALGKKTAIAEQRFLGGTCVNVGCVPKKLFSYAAEFSKLFQDAKSFGWQVEARFDWNILRDNKTKEIERLNNIYQQLLDSANVTLFSETAKLIGNNKIQLASGAIITADKILLATGGKALLPEIAGSQHCLLSDDLFYLPALPKKMLVIGGGYIGTEFASIFSLLGVQVTQILREEKSFLRGFDTEIIEHLRQILVSSDAQTAEMGKFQQIYAQIARIEKNNDTLNVTLKDGTIWQGDAVLSAVGRGANIIDLGLENVGITPNEKGFLSVDDTFQTSAPHIYAIGDMIGTTALTPIAIRQAMIFVQQQFTDAVPIQQAHLFPAIDEVKIPKAVFSLPPIGVVGLTQAQAAAQYATIRIYRSQFRAMKHSLSTRAEKILMKLIVNDQDDCIVGCHIVGSDAAEMIQLVAPLMGMRKTELDNVIPLHPTSAEELVTLHGTPEIISAS